MIYIDHLFHLINLTHVLQKVDETTFHACDIYIYIFKFSFEHSCMGCNKEYMHKS